MANIIPATSAMAPSFVHPTPAAAAAPIDSLLKAQEKIAEANQSKQEDLMALMQRQIEQLKIENENLEKDKELLNTIVADNAATIDALQRKLAFEVMQSAQNGATINEQKEIIAELRIKAEDLGRLVEVYKVYRDLSVLNVAKYSGSNSPYTSKAYAMYDVGEMFVKYKAAVDSLLADLEQKLKK